MGPQKSFKYVYTYFIIRDRGGVKGGLTNVNFFKASFTQIPKEFNAGLTTGQALIHPIQITEMRVH